MVDTISLPTALNGLGPVELAFSDFRTGTYRIGGVSKTLGDLWVSDDAWGTFDPASVVVAESGGLQDGNGTLDAAPTASAALFAAIMQGGGFIALIDVVLSDENSRLLLDLYTTPNYDFEYLADIQTTIMTANIRPGDLGGLSNHSTTGNNFHRVAARFTPTKVSVLRDDGAMHKTADATTTPTLTAFSVGLHNAAIVRQITFYRPEFPLHNLFL